MPDLAALLRRHEVSEGGGTGGAPVQERFEREFGALAADPEAFHATMSDVYGAGYDRDAAEALRRRALDGDFGWLPRVEYVDAATLGGGNAAYDAAGDRILIRDSLRGGDTAARVFVEEVGHALDTRLNAADTVGDEGELFQRLLAGEKPSAEARAAMRADDDRGTIVVDGQRVDVEFSWFTDTFVDPFVEHVVDPIREHVVDPVVDTVQEHVIDPIKEHVVDPFREHVIEPLVDTVKGFVGDVIPIVKDLAKFPFDLAEVGLEGAGNVLGALGRGDLGGAWDALVDTGKDLGATVAYQVTDTVLMGAHALSNVIGNITGTVEERGLRPEEIEYLRGIYGDSIDYGAVTIQSGGPKEWLNMRANVVGNDVFMPESDFNADGSLTPGGLVTLGHELGHVWQFQNRGPEYIGQAIYAQVSEGSRGVGSGEGYDWLAAANRGESFDDMNPESQAELASFIGQSLGADGEVDRALLQDVLRDELGDPNYTLPNEVFDIVTDAHDILRAG